MVPASLRRLVEDIVPWFDRDAERRHDERSRYIHDRSVEIRQEVEARIARSERIRYAYRAYDQRFER